MRPIKNISGPCQHCGGAITFRADATGSVAPCPHCGQATELTVAVPEVSSGVPRKAIVFLVVSAVILVLTLVVMQLAFKRAQRLADPPPPASAAESGRTR